MKIAQIMTRDVLTIGPEGELRDVARLLVENGISGLPVCDAQREVVGVISEGDILYKEKPRIRHGKGFLARFGASTSEELRKANATKVQDAMTAPAITVPPYYSVSEAARLMSEHGINRLPVVKNGELVGIVTRTDLVRAFVRSDEDIRNEIEQDVLIRTLWIDPPGGIDIEVDKGSVLLTGHRELRSDALLLERLVARVPGVVSVKSDLTWNTDDTTRREKRELAHS